MSSIQTFLVIGGLILLSYLIINFYRISGTQYSTKTDNEAAITATAVGQSLVEEIYLKAFDEKTVSKMISSPDSLTLPAYLGPDAGETSRSLYDDIDDYNNLAAADSLGGLGYFNYKVKVYYVKKFLPDQLSTVRTFTKRVEIAVKNRYMKDTLKLNHVYAF